MVVTASAMPPTAISCVLGPDLPVSAACAAADAADAQTEHNGREQSRCYVVCCIDALQVLTALQIQ
jgi:hypothetical protein